MNKAFFDLTDKIIFITGASGHLGAAMTRRLHKAGAHVCINGRDKTKLVKLADTIDSDSKRIEIYDFDISDEKAQIEAVRQIQKTHGRLDGLVNNAFIPLSASVFEASVENFQDCFEVNVSATFSLSQKCFALLEKTGETTSSIVNIGSMYGMVSPDPAIYGDSGMNNPPFYGASKAALIQLTKYLSAHIIDKGIRTNAISPGPIPPQDIKTKMPEFHDQLCAKTPMKRIGRADEVAAAVHFLLSDDSSYINGANIPVDGGWTAW